MRNISRTCTLLLAAGCASSVSAATDPTTLVPSQRTVNQAGHIYFNVSSGEKIITLMDDGQTAPADTGLSEPVWASCIQAPCAPDGYGTAFFYAVEGAPGSSPLLSSIRVLDYGDIEHDTVIDCVQINWVTSHPDSDMDGDDFPDGVEELAGEWIFWEADNGRPINQCTRLPIAEFLFFNLPGNTPDNQNAGALTRWTADIDLVGFSTSSNLSFEIGNTDDDCQGAAFCRDFDVNSDGIPDGVGWSGVDFDFDSLPDSDLDGNGWFDWAWSVNFYQPGSGNDFDSDSDTGSLAGSFSDTIGITLGVPEGQAIDNGDGTWTWEIDTTADAAGLGQEDRFVIYERDTSGNWVFDGGYDLGGFACSGGLISTGGVGYTPPAMFKMILYTPGSSYCPADCNMDGQVNFFDISCFITGYNNGADFNGDGSTNFFDVSAFLVAYQSGCP